MIGNFDCISVDCIEIIINASRCCTENNLTKFDTKNKTISSVELLYDEAFFYFFTFTKNLKDRADTRGLETNEKTFRP